MVNQIVATLLCFISSLAILALSASVLMKMTRYNDWQEIRRGNIAAGMVFAGNILGLGIILYKAITTNNNPFETWIWGLVGAAMLALSYIACERLAPKLDIDVEISNGNVAIGLVLMGIFLSISLIIAGSIA